MLGAIDQCNFDMFEVFDRRVANDRRGISAAGEKENCGYGSANGFKLTDHEAPLQGRRGGLLRKQQLC